ncbi:MAG TPA: response regulator transcription factor [Bryobacteraceae bacterium]|nr:response regulator transcription factor [Bryobacteraceae bacterium]
MPVKSHAASGVARSRVFIVDDHPIVREGLALLINREPDLCICGDADEASSALRLIQELKPDLAVVDISLNGPDGLVLLKDIRAHDPNLPVLILSMLDELLYAERALHAGASGYIMKQEATERVLVAIRRILAGEIYVSERMANRMLHRFASGGQVKQESPIADLTDRELEVFRLIGEGHGTRQIAEELRISVKTVESYQAHIKEKLSLTNARELVQRAIQWMIDNKQPA